MQPKQQQPEIARKCMKVLGDTLNNDKEYSFWCISVDDPSFYELGYTQPPEKPSIVKDYEAMAFDGQQAMLRATPDFWTNQSMPAGAYLERFRHVSDRNRGLKHKLMEMAVGFELRGDQDRLDKVNAMLATYPAIKKDVPEDIGVQSDLPSVLKQFGAKVTKFGAPRKVFGYDD